MIKKITGMRKKCMAILLAIIISISTLPLETLQIFPTIINYLKSEVNEIYALSVVDANSSGIFVGTFDAYGFDGNAYTIDGVNYELSEDYDDVQIANTLDYFLISENVKKDTRVVYRLSEGKLQQMVPISYVIRPAITLQVEKNSSNSEQTFVYLNGEFTRESVPMNVTLEVVYEPNSIFSKEEIQNLTNLSIPVKEMKLFFRPNEDNQDKLNFGKTSILKREITEVKEEEIPLMYGEKEYYEYNIYVQEDYVPQAVDEKESVACLITSANGAEYYGWDVDIHIGNIDIQYGNITKIKAGSSEGEALNTIEEELSGETSIGLDANLYNYFSAEQIEEMETFLTVYTSLMINADKIEEKNIFQDMTEKLKKEVKSKIYSELGLTSSTILGVDYCESEVIIRGKSKSGEEIDVTFSIELNIYSSDSLSSGYGSFGKINYVMTNPDDGAQVKGIAAVTYVDLEAFANLVLDYVKIAYDKAWGKKADKVASMFVSKPIDKLLQGKYSGRLYKLLRKATTSSVKTMAATISTDTETTGYPLKKISVSSPVDVYIYNSDETLCGSIIDNKIDTNTGEVFFYINGDERYVYTTGEDYYIQFVGNGQNAMTYEIEEYEYGTSIRTVTSKDVEIKDGQVYTAYIPEDLGTKCSMYELEDEEGNTIGIDSDTDAVIIEDIGFKDRYCLLDKDGVLTIWGEGVTSISNRPWLQYKDEIRIINIEDGITCLGDNIFYGCINVVSASIPDSITEIEDNVFSECSSLLRINLPDSVVNLGDWVFKDCSGLSEIKFSSEITEMGKGICENCTSLKKIEIPDNVLSIGEDAFLRCLNLEEVKLSNNIISIGWRAFEQCSKLKEIDFPDSLKEIAGYSFAECSSLEEIRIPGSVDSMGQRAFERCTSLTDVNVSEGVPYIGFYAFSYCDKLTNVRLPETISTLDEGAFCYCSSLKMINIPDGVMDIEQNAFTGCSSLESMNIPAGVTIIEDYVFAGCSSLIEVTFSENVTNIGSNAFYRCSSLEKIGNLAGVINIGDYAFGDCTSLKKVDNLKSVTDIGKEAFSSCSELICVTGLKNILNIGDYAFCYCGKLSDVDCLDSVINIGYRAFYCCGDLCNIGSLTNVKSIGEEAFNLCFNLSYIGEMQKVEFIGKNAFNNCRFSEITLSDELTKLEDGVFFNCFDLKNIIFSERLTDIGRYAFNFTGLINVIIPNSVMNIGDYAFNNCNKLLTIVIPDSVKTIGENVFNECEKLTIYGYKNSLAESYALENNIPFVALDNNSEEVPGESTSNTDNTNTSNSEQSGTSSVKRQETSEPSASKKNTEIGKLVEDKKSKAVYKVTENTFDQLTVTYVRPISKKIGVIKIPDNVSINGENYKVVSVATNAFSGCKKLKSVTIGKNATAIGNNAFKNCTSLKKVIIPAKVTSIGKNAFAGCKKLKNVIVKTKVLKKIGKNAFKGINKAAKIKVPKKQLKKYQKLFKKAKLSKNIKITK